VLTVAVTQMNTARMETLFATTS